MAKMPAAMADLSPAHLTARRCCGMASRRPCGQCARSSASPSPRQSRSHQDDRAKERHRMVVNAYPPRTIRNNVALLREQPVVVLKGDGRASGPRDLPWETRLTNAACRLRVARPAISPPGGASITSSYPPWGSSLIPASCSAQDGRTLSIRRSSLATAFPEDMLSARAWRVLRPGRCSRSTYRAVRVLNGGAKRSKRPAWWSASPCNRPAFVQRHGITPRKLLTLQARLAGRAPRRPRLLPSPGRIAR